MCLRARVRATLFSTCELLRRSVWVAAGAKQLGDAAGTWLCHGPQGNVPCRASAITLRRKGRSAVDHVGQATSALALCQLVAHLSSVHGSLGNSWSSIAHMNTRLKITFSYIAWSPAFSVAPLTVNLQRSGGVFEYALKGGWPCELKWCWELPEIKNYSMMFLTCLIPEMKGKMRPQALRIWQIPGQIQRLIIQLSGQKIISCFCRSWVFFPIML